MNTDPLLYLRDKEKVLLADYLQWLVSRDYFGGSRLALDNFIATSVKQNKLQVFDSQGIMKENCFADDIRTNSVTHVALCPSNYIQEESVIGNT